jgi:hypothetical protein
MWKFDIISCIDTQYFIPLVGIVNNLLIPASWNFKTKELPDLIFWRKKIKIKNK